MCGITGVITKKGESLDRVELKQMQASMTHRGPDGGGNNRSRRVGLYMRRLSIIDLQTGQQPMTNESGSVEMVANGEIYNYKDLVGNLKKKGHKFQTKSDIETITHLYEDLGIEFVKHLRGMFAIALLDKKRKVVYLIRDRMGEKPLYWTKTKNGVVFGSEMKTILKAKGVNKKLNYSGIDKYFHYYYIPEPETMFKYVHKLRAGSYLKIDLENMKHEEVCYWNPDEIEVTNTKDPSEEIRDTFAESCRLTLTADVPVGISLSGGIDSGAILAFSAPLYKDRMKAFSIGYEGTPPSDEREMARKLAKRFKVEFIEQELKTKDIVEDFPKLVWEGDDPIADIAGHGIKAVNSLARENKIKVLLGGIGGDELFWGYPWTGEAAKKTLERNLSWQSRLLGRKQQMFFYDQNPGFTTAKNFTTKMYHKEFGTEFEERNSIEIMDCEGLDLKDKEVVGKKGLSLIREVWLKSNCIALNDRLSMAASVELRSPFLDYKLVETALGSHRNITSFDKDPKYYFKKAMKGILPNEVIKREKRGFTPPVGEWVKGINEKYIHLLSDGFLTKKNILDKKKISVLIKTWKTLPMYWYPIYQIILLEIWGREFVLGQNYEELK
jgi:asparagine synthase (glutamine-hydrolysing)